MDNWNNEGYFHPNLMIAYESYEDPKDFIPFFVFKKNPSVFV